MSGALITALRRAPGTVGPALSPPVEDADPWGEDAQLALYLAYELHYRGLPGVDDAWEWDPRLLSLRARLESAFLAALRDAVGDPGAVDQALADVLHPGPDSPRGPSALLADEPDLGRFREYAVHRSVFQLKEADPQALLIPRLTGRAKAAVVTVEFDEFGAGRAERVHAALFADLMRGLGLDDAYNAYLDRVPAPMLAVVNLMSLFGWHRRLRGMAAGHFAALETASPPGAARLADTLERLGVDDPACTLFFTEHVEADAVHEQLMRREVLGGLLAEEPDLADDVAFGIRAATLVEDGFAEHLGDAWGSGRSSLRGGSVL
ncbi:iron-containing redox enzyme family protein [Yinghuangia seranimata]|uniref:iron-containing redox enzyme family protein n=1 Tax=Yinghuangia seranimata TaxID=408067 RepID=UPI00248BCCA9|nr:iron-containing redox enzyme family protein [Yinghuangia seranimata]MDI2125421.1 iron-containing redox enzyme family protein [Yinghuangia seranimata]